jgi:hypothetical protein
MAYYFPSSQSHAIQYARTLLQILSNHLSDFSNFDAQRFIAQFVTDFSVAITAAENIQDDETIIDQQSIKTQAVEDIMVQARKEFQQLKYFVQKTFPNNVNIFHKFGFNEYNEIRANTVKMIPFLFKVYKIADENRSALNMQGCTNNRIDSFDLLYQNLANAIIEQDLSKNDRLILTQSRHIALDNLFDNFVTPIREVGKLIYADNPAMYMQFLLPKRSSAAAAQSTDIAANTQSAVFQDVNPNAVLEIKNEGATPLTFYIAPNESTLAPTNAVSVAPNTTQVVNAQDIITNSGTVLVVWNQENITGSYLVNEMET